MTSNESFLESKNNKFGGDLIYFQGHSAPGMYARAFLEGRLSSDQLDRFRQEVNGPRPVILSSSMANAEILAISNCVDGTRANHGNISSKIFKIFN